MYGPVGGGGGGHNFYVTRRGVRAFVGIVGRGRYVILLYVRLIIQPPPPDNYCTVPKLHSARNIETGS